MTDLDNELASSIAELYRAPLDDFVRRRDLLAKEMRGAGNRDTASIVKNLRKPSRHAWALNVAVHTDREAIAALDAALMSTVDAHAGDGDVRSAIAGLRAAARDLANAAVLVAADAGLHIESSVLANAVLAILGAPESLTRLRRGSLVDVPAPGGVDFLASLTIAPSQPVASAKPQLVRDARDIAARTLREAEASLQLAEERLREVESEVQSLREKVERARQAAESLTSQSGS